MGRTANDDRSDSMNPNNDAYDDSMDNHSNQLNPNNDAYQGAPDDDGRRRQLHLQGGHRIACVQRAATQDRCQHAEKQRVGVRPRRDVLLCQRRKGVLALHAPVP